MSINVLTVNEGSVARYRAFIQDHDLEGVLAASVTGLTLTLLNVANQAVINVRNEQNALNVNNVTFVSASGIVSAASNATPIVVTATAHGRSNEDKISIRGGLGNPAVNNTRVRPYWNVTKIDADSFSLDGSAGNGAYTSGGTWKYNLLEWQMQAADNVIVDAATGLHVVEAHVARFEFTFSGGSVFRHDVLIHVRNLSGT